MAEPRFVLAFAVAAVRATLHPTMAALAPVELGPQSGLLIRSSASQH